MRRDASREIGILLLAALAGGLVYAFAPQFWPLLPLVNLGLSATLFAVLALRIRALIRQDQRNLFTAELWFRAATLVYFALGNAVPYLVSEASLRQLRRHYAFSDFELLKFNLVVLVGIAAILATLAVTARPLRRLLPAALTPLRARGSQGDLVLVTAAFLIVGGVFRFSILLTLLYGATESLIPGFLRNLSYLYYAGIFLLVLLTLRTGGRLAPLAILLVSLELVVSAATFYKAEVMLTAIFVWLAFLLDRTTIWRLAGGFAALVLLFLTIVPLIDYGRTLMKSRYGDIEGGNLAVRLEFVQRYFESDVTLYRDNRDRVERALRRLSYVNVSTFTMDRYDDGLPGDTYADAAIVLIPRAIWPGKPEVSNQGSELTYLFEGFRESSTGQGLFSEAYWNFGWAGVVFGLAFYGLLMSILTQISLLVLRQQLWVFLPVVLSGIRWGGRVDGTMTVDVVGIFALTGVLFSVLIVMRIFLNAMSRHSGPAAPRGLAA